MDQSEKTCKLNSDYLHIKSNAYHYAVSQLVYKLCAKP